MSLEAILLASIPGALALIGVIIQAAINDRKEKNRPKIDLSVAEKTEAETEQLRHEITKDILTQTATERKQLRQEIDELRSSFKIIVDFARVEWRKSKMNYEYMEKIGVAKDAPAVPASDFPTGPLVIGRGPA